ncbi:MAG: arylamine N-acetyltransferase [Anaerolineae bacterium]
MDVQTYLARIKYAGATEPTSANLKNIHEAHMLAVPFENLDIHLNRPIILDEERIFNKIVLNNRGGFCYEMNRIQAWLLDQLGFDVKMLSSRSMNAEGVLGIEYDHLMLLVRCPADPHPGSSIPWLADVGWGDGFLYPKRLDQLNIEQADGSRAHIIKDVGDGFFVLVQQGYDGVWKNQYHFNLQPHAYSEYESACQHHQTSPESHFPKKRVCTLATKTGRITVTEGRFIETINGVKTNTSIKNSEFESVLANRFGIALTNPQWK